MKFIVVFTILAFICTAYADPTIGPLIDKFHTIFEKKKDGGQAHEGGPR